MTRLTKSHVQSTNDARLRVPIALRPLNFLVRDYGLNTVHPNENLDLLQRISEHLEMPALLSLLESEIRKLNAFDGLTIAIVDPHRLQLIVEKASLPAVQQGMESALLHTKVPVTSFQNTDCRLHNDGAIILRPKDKPALPEHLKQQSSAWRVDTFVLVPLFQQNKLLGLITAFTQQNNVVYTASAALEEIAAVFAPFLAHSVDAGRLKDKQDKIDQQAHFNKKLFEFIHEITTLNNTGDIFEVITSELLRLFPFDIAGICLEQNGRIQLRHIGVIDDAYAAAKNRWSALYQKVTYELTPSDGATSVVFSNNTIVYVEDIKDILHLPMSPKDEQALALVPELQSLYYVPIRYRHDVIGVLWLLAIGENANIDGNQKDLILRMAEFIGTALENAKIYQQAAEQNDAYLRTHRLLLEAERGRTEALEHAKHAAEQSTKTKSVFLANMSHEIRTPMNAIIGFTELALNEDSEELKLDYLSRINRASKNLLGIVNDVLDFSKIEAGKMELEAETCSLNDVFSATYDLFSAKAAQKHLDLIFHVDPAIPDLVTGDSLRISEILNNLINNAIKFTEKGHIALSAEIADWQDRFLRLKITVSDTGIGIPQEQIAKLWDAFTQGDEGSTRKFGGTGLGLSICKSLVEMMNGTISIQSEPGLGSRFSFDIKLEHAKDAGISEDHLKRLRTCKPKIIVVADDSIIGNQIVMQLGTIGLHVAYADWEQIKALKFDNDQDFMVLSINQMKTFGQALPDIPDTMNRILITPHQHIRSIPDHWRQNIDHAFSVPIPLHTVVDILITPREKPEAVPTAAVESDIGGNLKGLKVLAAEDNGINQELIRALLQKAAIEVDIAVNGHACVDLMSRKNYDFVLMDMQMPGMNGIDATIYIREQLKSRVPIVAMTANVQESDRQKCLEAGMNDFMTKPIDRKKLFAIIEHYCIASNAHSAKEVTPTASQETNLKVRGFDIAEALQRMACDEATYQKLLHEFYTHHNDDSNRLIEFLSSENTDGAANLISTIKGIAANLAANHLQKTAEALENAIRTEDTDIICEAIPPFHDEFSSIMKALAASKTTKSN